MRVCFVLSPLLYASSIPRAPTRPPSDAFGCPWDPAGSRGKSLRFCRVPVASRGNFLRILSEDDGFRWVPVAFHGNCRGNPMAMGSHSNSFRFPWVHVRSHVNCDEFPWDIPGIPLAITMIATAFGGFPRDPMERARGSRGIPWELPWVPVGATGICHGFTRGAHHSVADCDARPPSRFSWVAVGSKFPWRKAAGGSPRNPVGTR